MRPLGALLALIVAVGAISGTIWFARPKETGIVDPWAIKQRNAIKQQKERDDKITKQVEEENNELEQHRPAIADKPPFPKVGPCEKVYQFGKMGVQEEKKHSFAVKNIGQAPLLLSRGPSSCKCTIGTLKKKTLAPGESSEVELSWTPKEASNNFAQWAKVWTNDPDLPEIEFKIVGQVATQFAVRPTGTWRIAGAITDVQDGTTEGLIGSDLDEDFKITSVETSDPHVKVTYKHLGRRDARHEGMRAAYDITATVDRKIPPGSFRARMKIHTTIGGGKTIDAEIAGYRTGPILFLPPTGAFWHSDSSMLSFPRFKHEVGAKAVLPVLVYSMKEPFKVVGVKADPDFIKFSMEPNPAGAGERQQSFRFVFQVPPGAPAVTRVMPNAGHVTLTTNHPTMKEINFIVEITPN